MLFGRNVFQTAWILASGQKVCTSKFSSLFHQTEGSVHDTSERRFTTSKERDTLNKEELQKFQEFEKLWWNEKELPALHEVNRVTVPVITDGILNTCSPQYKDTLKPLRGITVLDVGCGGGILAEPLARLGAHVTGLDPVAECIKAARHHAELDPEISNNLEYLCGTVEDHCKGNIKYDVVLCSEVLDHVDNVPHMVKCCTDLVADNGYLHFSTINRSFFAYLYVILLAENVFTFIPRGTHQWEKFVKPSELKMMLEMNNCQIFQTRGQFYDPIITKTFYQIPYTGGFYSVCATKQPCS